MAKLFRVQAAALVTVVAIVAAAALAPVATADTAPSDTSPPTISGQASQGKTLTAASGSWTGTAPISFTYQWLRCNSAGASCSSISGATTSTYTLAGADVNHTIRIQVTASNNGGSSQMVSTETALVTNTVAPANTAAPALSGAVTLGSKLTVSNGTWTGSSAPTFTYQWQRCDANGSNCADISGATSQSYTLVAADVGNRVQAVVKASNSAGSASKTSTLSGAVASAPSTTAAPVVSGTAMVGQALKVDPGTWTGSPVPAIGYQWARCDANGNNCADIGGSVSQGYTLVAADAGHRMKVHVTGTNSAGSKTVDSAVTGVVVQPVPPAAFATPLLTGKALVGQTLHTTLGSWSGTQPIATSIRWQRCNAAGAVCLDVPGATAQAYLVGRADLGLRLQAIVTAQNLGGQVSQGTGPSAVVAVTPRASTLAQRVVQLRPGSGRIRLDLIQLRTAQSVRLSLGLDVWLNGAWARMHIVNVAYGEPQTAHLLLFQTKNKGRSAAVTIRYRLNRTHIGAFSYAADAKTLRRVAATRIAL